MKKWLVVFILLIIAFLGWLIFSGFPMLQVYAGFSAKRMCSCHFVSGRTPESILEQDLEIASIFNTKANDKEASATSSLLGVSRKAIYRKGFGCTLLSEIDEDKLRKTVFPKREIPATNFELPKDSSTNKKLELVVDKAFSEPYPDKKRYTRAVVVLHGGKIITERYADGFTKATPLMGWSMTKSVTNALIGILSKQGKIDIFKPAPIKAWQEHKDDPRKDITIDHLLRMSSGLYFEEAYDKLSTVNEMLWLKADAGKVAYSQSLSEPVDQKWYYSSGTSNILSAIIRSQFDDYNKYLLFPYSALFDKLGMKTAVLETDANGTFVGSSLMYASARDWAKFGQLYLQDGVWNGERILPEGWVTYSRTRTPNNEPYGHYTAHFWRNAKEDLETDPQGTYKWAGVPDDAFYASGYEGQTVMIIPSLDLVIVRLGLTVDQTAWNVGQFAAEVIEALTL